MLRSITLCTKAVPQTQEIRFIRQRWGVFPEYIRTCEHNTEHITWETITYHSGYGFNVVRFKS